MGWLVAFVLFAFSEDMEPPIAGGKSITCPSLNFFNIRRQVKTDLAIDDPPTGWKLIRAENASSRKDNWYPTVPAGATVEVRRNAVFLRCDYKPRNWVVAWIPGSAMIEKNIGVYRLGTLCWSFEGPERKPNRRQLTSDEKIFLPCGGGKCELLCSDF